MYEHATFLDLINEMLVKDKIILFFFILSDNRNIWFYFN
jgi:hypothetical protein